MAIFASFARCIFRTFTSKAAFIILCYVAPHQWYQNRWPWITLNGHFALKSVSGSATNGLASPAFGQNFSNICRATIYCQRQKCSPGNVVSGSIRFMQIFLGDPCTGGITWEWGGRKWRFSFFRSLYLIWTFTFKATIIIMFYVSP